MNPILAFTNWVWGYPMLIWLVGGGIFLSFKIHMIQFTKLGFIMKQTIIKSIKGEDATSDGEKVSGYKAVTGALASTLGAGSIVGAAMAVGYGGPGGVFWLLVAGLVACSIKYSEVVIAMKHRERGKNEWIGGPQYYLTKATGWKWIGVVYAVCCIICLFLAASAQIGSIVDTLGALKVPKIPATVVITLAAGLIVLGGMSRLLDFTEKIVPVMSIMYVVGGILVILLNIQALPGAFASIFRYAFTGRAAFGGFGGATLAMCIRWGVCRGIYSTDAGVGVTTITHVAADVNHPAQQGLWGIFEVVSTIAICLITCLVILVTGVWETNSSAATLTLAGFQAGIGKAAGGFIVTVALLLFCFTTAVAQTLFGCGQMVKLFGNHASVWGKYVFLGLMFVGGIVGISTIINYVDFMSALLIFINMLGIYMRSNEIKEVTEEYFKNPERWEHEMWEPWKKANEEK